MKILDRLMGFFKKPTKSESVPSATSLSTPYSPPPPSSSGPDESLLKKNFTLSVIFTAAIYLGFLLFGAFTFRSINLMEKKGLRGVYLVARVVHLNESLTGMARLATETGDKSIESEYQKGRTGLNTAIRSLRAITPKKYQDEGAVVSEKASQVMAAVEAQVFDLVRQGKRQDAKGLITGHNYLEQKQTFALGLDRQKEILIADLKSSVGWLSFVFKGLLFVFFLLLGTVVYFWKQFSVQVAQVQTALIEKDVIIKEKADELKNIEAGLTRVVGERTEPLQQRIEELEREIEEHKRDKTELTEQLNVAPKLEEPSEPEPFSTDDESAQETDLFQQKEFSSEDFQEENLPQDDSPQEQEEKNEEDPYQV